MGSLTKVGEPDLVNNHYYENKHSYINQLKTIIRESIFDDSSSQSQQAAVELYLYIVNDSNLYHRFTVPSIQNLQRKFRKGTYDRELAVKLWEYVADAGAKQYMREFNSDSPVQGFDKKTRLEVAKELRDHYEEQVMEEK